MVNTTVRPLVQETVIAQVIVGVAGVVGQRQSDGFPPYRIEFIVLARKLGDREMAVFIDDTCSVRGVCRSRSARRHATRCCG